MSLIEHIVVTKIFIIFGLALVYLYLFVQYHEKYIP